MFKFDDKLDQSLSNIKLILQCEHFNFNRV
jgi:hypothetical protein